MAYKVVDIYKDLPKKQSCSDCGKPGCFAFATGMYLEGLDPARCPHLEPETRVQMEARLKARGDGTDKEAATAQAAKYLFGELKKADFASIERTTGLTLSGDAFHARLLGTDYRITEDRIVSLGGDPPNVWVKVLLLLYLTRASEKPVLGRWIAYRDLPNTISKVQTYEKNVDRLAQAYGQKLDALDRAVKALGGTPSQEPSADGAWLFQPLPKVPLLLLLWRGDDDFPPRASILLDEGVLEFLDQEGLVFLAELLVNRLLGEKDPEE